MEARPNPSLPSGAPREDPPSSRLKGGEQAGQDDGDRHGHHRRKALDVMRRRDQLPGIGGHAQGVGDEGDGGQDGDRGQG
jgi:hypothetical protein